MEFWSKYDFDIVKFVVYLPGTQPEIFQGAGGIVELGHCDKYFVKMSRKKNPAGKNKGVFPPRYS